MTDMPEFNNDWSTDLRIAWLQANAQRYGGVSVERYNEERESARRIIDARNEKITALERQLELWQNGAQCRMEERDESRRNVGILRRALVAVAGNTMPAELFTHRTIDAALSAVPDEEFYKEGKQ